LRYGSGLQGDGGPVLRQNAAMGRNKAKRATEDQVGADIDIARAIKLGAAAGACRAWAVQDPSAAPGMTKAAEAYSARAAGLLTEWGDRQ
jgi:hypothetical protein